MFHAIDITVLSVVITELLRSNNKIFVQELTKYTKIDMYIYVGFYSFNS